VTRKHCRRERLTQAPGPPPAKAEPLQANYTFDVFLWWTISKLAATGAVGNGGVDLRDDLTSTIGKYLRPDDPVAVDDLSRLGAHRFNIDRSCASMMIVDRMPNRITIHTTRPVHQKIASSMSTLPESLMLEYTANSRQRQQD
jgi:hypothetical protein